MRDKVAAEMSIVPLPDVMNLYALAADLSRLLVRPDNADIEYEFRNTYNRYTGDLDKVFDNLTLASADCRPGVRHQWVVFAGETAVGMSVVRLSDETPETIPENYPNVSLFVCEPFRKSKIGTRAVQTCLHTVRLEFGGFAWTVVKHHNKASQRLMLSAGFVPEIIRDIDTVYTYSRSNQAGTV